MRWEWRHQHLHADPTHASSSPPSAEHCAPAQRSCASTCRSAQQAAAAWAWFEHGGSSCITPSKAEGLNVAAKGFSKHLHSTGPSRFKKEGLRRHQAITQQGGPAADDPDSLIATEAGHARRRHSFHNDDRIDRTSDMYRRFGSSSRHAPASYIIHSVDDSDQHEAENEEVLNVCPNKTCSDLLDTVEVEAVCRQLQDQLTNGKIGLSRSAERQESHKAHHDHDNHHHHINAYDAIRRLFHLHIKTSSGRDSSSAAPAVPFFCSSIATVNSIVDHHHHHRDHRSSKHFRDVDLSPLQHETAKRLQDRLHKWGIGENLGRVSSDLNLNQVSASADGGELTLKQQMPQQKLSRDDGEIVAQAPHSLKRQHRYGAHVHHIHHHHHHFYHQYLQQTKEAVSAQDARRLLTQKHYWEGDAGAHDGLRAPKIYSSDEKKRMISAADHGGRRAAS